MNKKKKTSQVNSSTGDYTAPKIDVMELRYMSVICASNTNPSLGESEDSWS